MACTGRLHHVSSAAWHRFRTAPRLETRATPFADALRACHAGVLATPSTHPRFRALLGNALCGRLRLTSTTSSRRSRSESRQSLDGSAFPGGAWERDAKCTSCDREGRSTEDSSVDDLPAGRGLLSLTRPGHPSGAAGPP